MALPASDEIHLLLVEEATIDDELLVSYARVLSSDERARHERIRTPADRRRFLITRAAIRGALSNCIPEVSPADWQFSRGPHARPEIAGPERAANLTFNISHAQDLLVIAIAREGNLGVDVERIDRLVDTTAVARRYFAPEEFSQMQPLPEAERRDLFFELWTLKEAWVKATGTGLAKSLRHVSFALTEDRIDLRLAGESNELSAAWQFWQLRPSATHQLAVAYAPGNEACGSGPSPRSPMKLLVNDMVPIQSLTPRDLPPFRTR